jgi:indole-3-glycerol phosphate synthase
MSVSSLVEEQWFQGISSQLNKVVARHDFIID